MVLLFQNRVQNFRDFFAELALEKIRFENNRGNGVQINSCPHITRLHRKDQYEGTGLGLALCKKIAELHGGSISAEGWEGIGASFVIELPVNM